MSGKRGYQIGDKILFRNDGSFSFLKEYNKFYGVVVAVTSNVVDVHVYEKKTDLQYIQAETDKYYTWRFYLWEIKHAPTPKFRMGDIVLLNAPGPYTWASAEPGVAYDTVYGIVVDVGKQVSSLILIHKGTKDYVAIVPGTRRWHYPTRLLRKASKAFIRSQP